MHKLFVLFALLFGLTMTAYTQDNHDGHNHSSEETHSSHDGHEHGDDHDHSTHQHGAQGDDHAVGHDGHAGGCHCHHGEKEGAPEEFVVSETAFHHIGDANSFHIWGDLYMPLPCFLYSSDGGWTILMSSAFKPEHHGNGAVAINRYVLAHGAVKRIADPNFPMAETEVCVGEKEVDGKHEAVALYGGDCYDLEDKSTLDGGVFGGGITSYYDFSITKNVFTMLIVIIVLFLVFRGVAKAYKKREGLAPAGTQGFFEPIILFLRDEVARPFIGHKADNYLPFLLTLFFFILGLNLIGQIPFFPGSANVTGNLGVTLVLAVFAFLVTNLNGNKHYWEHIFWMPGVPAWVKTILTPVEFMGVFLKPFTLMLRLFANITAGHIVLVSFIGLIFIFGNSGQSVGGALGGALASIPLTLFMMAIELLVAFIQAFVFVLLTASYIGAAVEEHHHEEHVAH